jgi:hypothetical protein
LWPNLAYASMAEGSHLTTKRLGQPSARGFAGLLRDRLSMTNQMTIQLHLAPLGK